MNGLRYDVPANVWHGLVDAEDNPEGRHARLVLIDSTTVVIPGGELPEVYRAMSDERNGLGAFARVTNVAAGHAELVRACAVIRIILPAGYTDPEAATDE